MENGCIFEMDCPVQGKTAKRHFWKAGLIFGTLFRGEKILYTAHDYSTVTQLFDRVQHFFGEKKDDPECKYPELNARVSSVRRAAGKEAIFFKNGAGIIFRREPSPRGVVLQSMWSSFDEAQELTDTQLKAIMATASSSPLRTRNLSLPAHRRGQKHLGTYSPYPGRGIDRRRKGRIME
ncbi:hypothetical protein B2M23_11305 [Eubacterium limosum]|uniref:Uncharacterized protein n=1 Tax=Eubacterium limosum TaxID=1736 RepID=A0AAC9QUU3_EUBLI|nr:hypothetical protein [Eubacterium limosum]ARD66092.1 hypothetical protein B2M23_11305 [Eubacterium limosum]